MTQALPDVMTINETSEYLRIPLSTLYKLAQDGRIPCQKVGRHWRFRRQAIENWLDHWNMIDSKNNDSDN
jgi:excisionase family DNA binding protein